MKSRKKKKPEKEIILQDKQEVLFIDPPMSCRPVPFWSWNDNLNVNELIRQIGEMKKQGMGGFFMHARLGLVTPYLSDDWMVRVNSCVEEANKLGMKSWLYDEDNWPSGAAGGEVTKERPDYYQQSLTYETITFREVTKFATDKDLVGLFITKQKGKTYTAFEPLTALSDTKWKDRNPDLMVFKIIYSGYVHPYSPYGYADLLNPQVTERFIQTTHEKYKNIVGRYFGNTVPGIFTDEPNIGQIKWGFPEIPMIPWTREFPAYFKEKKKYDLIPHLPSLFFPIGDYQKIRFDFWDMVTDKFVESYTKKLFDWCKSNKLFLTGHQLMEDRLVWQVQQNGACMPHYEFMQTPGMDHLCRDIKNPITAKQVTSVAAQLGWRRTISETYGMSGSNLKFEDQKWIADWQFAQGINLMNQHLASYSIRGHRKRDFPPTIHYQQPWFRYYKPVTDYMSRLSYLLSQGHPIRKILVIHPIEGIWTDFDPHWNIMEESDKNEIDQSFIKLTDDLLALHYDFDFGDEKLMEKYAGVNGKIFNVGKMNYDLVIISKTTNLRKNTVRLLNQFTQNGGTVLTLDSFPVMVNGSKNSVDLSWLKDLQKKVPIIKSDRKTLARTLSKFLKADIIIEEKKKKDTSPILYLHQKTGTRHFYFFCNTSRTDSFDTKIQLNESGKVRLWNPLTSQISEYPFKKLKDKTEFDLYFDPASSHLLEIDISQKPSKKISSTTKISKKPKRSMTLKNEWKLKVQQPNSLLLDSAKYRLDKSVWQKKNFLWKIQELTQKEMMGKWVNLEFEFQSEWLPDEENPCYLILETPDKFQIEINGEWVGNTDEGWWTDISFRKVNISKFLKKGKNSILLTTKIEKDTELENIYIIGNFKVQMKGNKEFKIIQPSEKIKTGDLISQGFPFYSGGVTLSQQINISPRKNQRFILNMPDTETCLIRILVNGNRLGQLNWQPFEMDITNHLHKGKNTISIFLVNTLRNLLGPHHQNELDSGSVTPASFSGNNHQTDKYQFVPFGFLKSPKINIY